MPKWLILLTTQGPKSWSNEDVTSAQNSGMKDDNTRLPTVQLWLKSTHNKKKQRETFITWPKATVRFHLIEWFVDVLMSFQVLPTTPHNIEILLRTQTRTHWLSGQQTHSPSYREKGPKIRTARVPTERAAYFPRVRCTTRDTGCLPIDSFLHWTLSTANLERKRRERRVCSKDQTTPRKRACNRRNTERRTKTGRHR